MSKPKIGLLALYLELYDTAMPEIRAKTDAFYSLIYKELQNRGLEVVRGPVCRLKKEFQETVRKFEESGADALVTLHLAYSPSLESSDVLANTSLPIIVLDTTPAYSYSSEQDAAELMYNHGIHGVMDMCSLLVRSGKKFWIEAGHWEKSDVLDRVAALARSAFMANAMRNARVGRIGSSFKGMGDFVVSDELLKHEMGVQVVNCDTAALELMVPDIASDEVQNELSADRSIFAGSVDERIHRTSIAAGLGVRRWIEKEKLSAFTLNFMECGRASGLPTVPFLEASKAMARGIGYAGEGDVLTAALVGSLAAVYPETTFCEMFCPDWEGGQIYLSHMGEMNVSLVSPRATLREYPFSWTDANNPVIAVGCYQQGDAVLVNLAPMTEGKFRLIVAPVKMQTWEGVNNMMNSVHGWFMPYMPISEFLAKYSRLGGTHHNALVYTDNCREIAVFGEMMGWDVALIGEA